jgi:5,10-methenyltetrahydromethanopterin hydrogenase
MFRIKVESEVTLGLVARVLVANPELAKIRIDVRGEDLSKEVALECAQMMVSFLAKQGVDANRLKPSALMPGADRVDFVIETRLIPKPQPIPLPTSLPGETSMPAGN